MNVIAPRVVFDAMVYLQAITSPSGTSARCFSLVLAGSVEIWVSRDLMLELGDVLTRPEVRTHFPMLTDDAAYGFLQRIRCVAREFDGTPPHALHLTRDPPDEPYLNLAVAIDADFLITWNHRHLGYLMTDMASECVDFRRLYPNLEIVDPVTFLKRQSASPPAEPSPA